MRRILNLVLLASVPAAAGCVWIFEGGSVEDILPNEVSTPRQVESPMKAFLMDGSTVVYERGGLITPESIHGDGVMYSVGLLDTVAVAEVALDSVIGIEAFQGQVHAGRSFFVSLGTTAAGVVSGVALFKAIFGSCPTLYASAEQGGVLQAEAFSYSIAPLLEGRDLDAMRITPDADGVVRLELRNEALETHYINELALVAVDHERHVRAISDERGAPIGVVRETAPTAAVDRGGANVLAHVLEEGGDAFASSWQRIDATSSVDERDFIDLVFSRPEGEEAVVVLRLRNSLLTTVLFYDLMLGRAGAGALDWLGRDMDRIGSVVELGDWFQRAMGLRVQVPGGDGWEDVARLPDTGPIAWEEVGVRIPLPESGAVRVRLSFFTDAWRIDRVSLGSVGPLASTLHLPTARIIDEGMPLPSTALELLAEPDDRYLTTYPGTSAMLEFEPPAPPPGATRSYLLSSQGYYSEWIRPQWIRDADRAVIFEPGEDTVESLMQLWVAKKDVFEAEFQASRIPVR